MTRARDARYTNGAVVIAERQSRGRGQRGNSWSSAEGMNLTFSAVLCPAGLRAESQFYLSKAVGAVRFGYGRFVRNRVEDQVAERHLCRRRQGGRHSDRERPDGCLRIALDRRNRAQCQPDRVRSGPAQSDLAGLAEGRGARPGRGLRAFLRFSDSALQAAGRRRLRKAGRGLYRPGCTTSESGIPLSTV